jgi:cytochrome c oxidase subunit II
MARIPLVRNRAPRRIGAPAVALAALPAAAHAAAPMSYMVADGMRQDAILPLLWGLLIISLLVVAIVSALLLAGMFRKREMPSTTDPRLVPIERPDKGLSWVYVGTAVSAVVLLGSLIWTFSTLAAVSGPRANAKLSIEIVGHQWWWEVRYLNAETARTFTTANEIHLPTGQPVRLVLRSADVIHSFWVPHLSGKTELIPGQQNETWMQADKPGVYRGECAEFCGLQHAHMAFEVIAQPPSEFETWWSAQLQPPLPPQSQKVAAGEMQFIGRCGICHTVNGTAANGRLGPDLSHLMGRRTIAAASYPNTLGYLSGWIADPQHLKPGNYMPVLNLTAAQLEDIRSFLETLK